MAEPRVYGWTQNSEDDPDPVRLLRLKVIAAHNLAKKYLFGGNDPYVQIVLVRNIDDTVIDCAYTKPKKKTSNPKWEEEFIFRVKPGDHHLMLEVFDENTWKARDDFLGLVELSLNHIPSERPDRSITHELYRLRPGSLAYVPSSGRSKAKGHLQIYHAYITASEPSKKRDSETQLPDKSSSHLAIDPVTGQYASSECVNNNTAETFKALPPQPHSHSSSRASSSNPLNEDGPSCESVLRNGHSPHTPQSISREKGDQSPGMKYALRPNCPIAQSSLWDQPMLDGDNEKEMDLMRTFSFITHSQ